MNDFMKETGRKSSFISYPGKREKVMLFFGYFSDERRLRKIIGQTGRIKHLGCLPYPEKVERLYHEVDAFLMLNIPVEGDMGGFGLVCFEASACGARGHRRYPGCRKEREERLPFTAGRCRGMGWQTE
jgi:hypothetical protein